MTLNVKVQITKLFWPRFEVLGEGGGDGVGLLDEVEEAARRLGEAAQRVLVVVAAVATTVACNDKVPWWWRTMTRTMMTDNDENDMDENDMDEHDNLCIQR